MDNSNKKNNRKEKDMVVYIGSEIKHGNNPIDPVTDNSQYFKELYDAIFPHIFDSNSEGKPHYMKLRLFDWIDDGKFNGFFDKLYLINSKEPDDDFLEFIHNDQMVKQMCPDISNNSNGVFFRLVSCNKQLFLPVFIDSKDVNIEIKDSDNNLVFST
jgi:hypothetical protein